MATAIDNIEKSAQELHDSVYGTDPDAQDGNVDDLGSDDADDSVSDDEKPAAKPEDFEHKYKVLQGKYSTELERMSNLLSTTLQERQSLAIELEKTKGSTPGATNDDPTDRFIDELDTEYPTIAKGLDAKIKKALQETLAKVDTRINETTQATGQLVTEKYITSLDTIAPGWRDIKDNPEFAQWLSRPDRYTGMTKFDLLRKADSERNATAVAAFYEDFAKDRSVTVNDDSGNDAIDDNRPSASPSRKSAPPGGISPSAAGNPAPSLAEKGGFITRAEINKLYNDRALGRFKGSDADWAKAEGRIMKAAAEGKVR